MMSLRHVRILSIGVALACFLLGMTGCDTPSGASSAANAPAPNSKAGTAPPASSTSSSSVEEVAATIEFPTFNLPVSGAVDMRGKALPQLAIEKWVSPEPTNLDRKVVMIEFWATWCRPCRQAIPHMNTLIEAFGDDLQIISVTSEDAKTIASFLKSTPMKSTVAIDSKARLANALRVGGIPHAFIISSDGIVRWQGHPMTLQKQDVAALIAANKSLLRRTQG